MARWIAIVALTAAATASVVAQPPPKAVTGVMIIRVKVNGPGGPMTGEQPPPPEGSPMPMKQGDMRSVVVAVPFKNLYQDVVYAGKPFSLQNNPKVFWMIHDLGKTLLFTDASRVQLEAVYDINTDVILKAKYTEWTKTRTVAGLFTLIQDALGFDQVETALVYAKELVRTMEQKKEGTAPKDVADFLRIYKELQAKFDETLPVPTEAAEWKKRLQASAIAEEKHYSVIHFGDQSVQAEALAAKLAELERNYKAFFLWHAVLGHTPTVPDKKQIVVLAKRAADMPTLRNQLEGSPIVTDSFYVANHNIVVLSPERLDDTGRSYLEMMKTEYDTGWDREKLLKGTPPPVTEKTPFGDIFRMSTNAIVERTLERDSIRGAVSRDCNRQLYVSSGIVPQYVALPKWLDQGLSNSLCKPKNPGVIPGNTPDKPLMVYGYRSGYGTPNYMMFREWKKLKARQDLPIGMPAALQSEEGMAEAAKSVLLAVLNDSYFDAARKGVDFDKTAGEAVIPGVITPPMRGEGGPQPPRGEPRPPNPEGGPMNPMPGEGENPGIELTAKAKLELKAQATAWALTYFLSRERPEGMKKYYAELDKLPRDLRLDKKLALQIFARSFSLMNPEQNDIDHLAMKTFAVKWLGYLDSTQESWRDIPVQNAPPIAPPNPMGGGPGPVPNPPVRD